MYIIKHLAFNSPSLRITLKQLPYALLLIRLNFCLPVYSMSHLPKSLDLDAAETQTSSDLDTPTLRKNLKDLGPLIDYLTSDSEEEPLEDFFQLEESNPELENVG